MIAGAAKLDTSHYDVRLTLPVTVLLTLVFLQQTLDANLLSTTMQSLIDAWEEVQASGQWQELQPEAAYPVAWWLIQLEEEPQELEPPLRWSD